MLQPTNFRHEQSVTVANRSFSVTKAKTNNKNAAKKSSGVNPEEPEPARDKKEAKEKGPLPLPPSAIAL
jgi:hypothetical protein